MAKKLMLRIEGCEECIHMDYSTEESGETVWRCTKNQYRMEYDYSIIPDWCPLEDWSEDETH